MLNQVQQPIRLMTRWYSDEILGQTLAEFLIEHSAEIERWIIRPERLLMLHSGPFNNLGDGLAYEDANGNNCQKLTALRFAKLVLRKNIPEQLDAPQNGWHVHSFYPIPYLPIDWLGDKSFNYLTRHLAGYFVSGIEDNGDGLAALSADLKLVSSQSSVQLLRLSELLEPLIQQVWPFDIAASFWQEQLNRPLGFEHDPVELLANWASQIRRLVLC